MKTSEERLTFIQKDISMLISLLEISGTILPALADGTEAWTLIENIRAAAYNNEEISDWK